MNENPKVDQLSFFDTIGSIAVCLLLKQNGIFTEEEFALLKESFKEIAVLTSASHFSINLSQKNPFAELNQYLKSKNKNLAVKFENYHSSQQRLLLDINLFLRNSCLFLIKELLLFSQSIYPSLLLDHIGQLKKLYSGINPIPLKSMNPRDDWESLRIFLGFPAEAVFNEESTAKVEAFYLLHIIQILKDLMNLPPSGKKLDSITSNVQLIASCLFDLLELNQSNDLPTNFQQATLITIIGIQNGIQALQDLIREKLKNRNQIQLPDKISKQLKGNKKWYQNQNNHVKKIISSLLM